MIMPNDFENKILKFAEQEKLFEDVDKVLVAVSGGADSMALLHCLWALKAQGKIDAELICAHLNHRIRGSESDGDEQFVIREAFDLGVKVIKQSIDIPAYAKKHKLSVETAARQWRLDTLQRVASENGCGWIATGHHKNDNAETVIQRLMRGTGFRGLGGIWPKRIFNSGVGYIRPLLCVGRDQIIEYLNGRKLKWREDSSNASLDYRRNFIRHQLLPEIQKGCEGDIAEDLWQLSCKAKRVRQATYNQIEQLWNKIALSSRRRVKLDLRQFLAQPEPIQVELIRHSLIWLGSGEGNLTEGHYSRLLELAQKNISNKKMELPNGFTAWREYKKIVFAQSEPKHGKEKFIGKTVEVKVPGKTQFGNYIIEAKVERFDNEALKQFQAKKGLLTEWFDFDKITGAVTVRYRVDGDKYVPLGMKEEKKIGQFLTDAKVPQDIRDITLVISDAEKIIWLWPIRMSEQAKITGNTIKTLQLRITQKRL